MGSENGRAKDKYGSNTLAKNLWAAANCGHGLIDLIFETYLFEVADQDVDADTPGSGMVIRRESQEHSVDRLVRILGQPT